MKQIEVYYISNNFDNIKLETYILDKEYYRKNKNAISNEFEINEEENLIKSSKEIDPLKLLNLKLAQGTITPQDYQQRVSLLQSNTESIISKKKLLDKKESKNYIG